MQICRSTLQKKMSDFNSKNSSYRTLQRKIVFDWQAMGKSRGHPGNTLLKIVQMMGAGLPEKVAQNCSQWRKPLRKSCSKLLEMAQTFPKKLLKIARNGASLPEKIAQNCSK